MTYVISAKSDSRGLCLKTEKGYVFKMSPGITLNLILNSNFNLLGTGSGSRVFCRSSILMAI